MRPRTIRRRGQFYHRRRSHWRLNLALALLGVALAGFVVVDMVAGSPPSGAPEGTAKKVAASPAQTALAELRPIGPTRAAAAAASTPPPRPDRPAARIAGPARDANRRGADAAAARLVAPTVRDADAVEAAPVQGGLAQRPRTPTGDCKTCGDDVPF